MPENFEEQFRRIDSYLQRPLMDGLSLSEAWVVDEFDQSLCGFWLERIPRFITLLRRDSQESTSRDLCREILTDCLMSSVAFNTQKSISFVQSLANTFSRTTQNSDHRL